MDDALGPAEEGLVRVETCAERAAVVIQASGEIDSQTIPPMVAALDEALAMPGVRRVVLDLDEVVFFGSGGIAFLAKADSDARTHGVALRVVVQPGGRVYRVLEMMGLTRIVALYPTRAEALRDG